MTGCNTTISAIAALAVASSRPGQGLPGDRAQQMADAMAKLLAFGIPAVRAEQIIREDRITHRFGPGDVEHLQLGYIRTRIWGLELAEHIACVVANFSRCYNVDTSQLAMAARN